jgi:hypothetical protein
MTCARMVVIAVAHGLAACCLAAATGAISGGHLNPAVTLAFVVAGKETLIRAGLYVGAQVRNLLPGSELKRECHCRSQMKMSIRAFSIACRQSLQVLIPDRFSCFQLPPYRSGRRLVQFYSVTGKVFSYAEGENFAAVCAAVWSGYRCLVDTVLYPGLLAEGFRLTGYQ